MRDGISFDDMVNVLCERLKAAMGGVEKVLLPGSIKVFHSTVEYKAKPERTTVKKAEPARTGRRFQLIEPEGEGV